MIKWGQGLTNVDSDVLKKLLGLLHRDEPVCPLDITELTRVGLQYASDDLEVLRGLDRAGVRAVLVAVLAERKSRS